MLFQKTLQIPINFYKNYRYVVNYGKYRFKRQKNPL